MNAVERGWEKWPEGGGDGIDLSVFWDSVRRRERSCAKTKPFLCVFVHGLQVGRGHPDRSGCEGEPNRWDRSDSGVLARTCRVVRKGVRVI